MNIYQKFNFSKIRLRNLKKIKDYDVDYMSEPMKKSASKTIEKVASAEGRSKKEISRDRQDRRCFD